MPRALSSAQANAPGAFMTSAPCISFGCQTEMKAPEGSWKTAMRPDCRTPNGGGDVLPAAASALLSGALLARGPSDPEHNVARIACRRWTGLGRLLLAP